MINERNPVIAGDVAEILARDLPWSELAGSTVLVTGASGMLPSYVVHSLLGLNDAMGTDIRVCGLVRNADKGRRVLAGVLDRPDFELIVHDVSEPLALAGRVDYVVHGASAARPALHAADPVSTIKANLIGSFNLLDMCVAKQSRAFVLMSSSEIYGAQPAGTELIDEQAYGGFDILNPRACYSEGKRAAETIAAVYQAQHGITCRIVRFGHVYGPGMMLDDGRVQADFAASVVSRKDIVLNSDGSGVRTYTYVADAVAGLFYALLRGEETAYNVADPGGLISVRELARLFIGARPERGLHLEFANASDAAKRYSPMAALGLDSDRVRQLGWHPEVDLPTGLDRWITELEWSLARDAQPTSS